MRDPINPVTAQLIRVIVLSIAIASLASSEVVFAQKSASPNPEAKDNKSQEPPQFDMDAWAKRNKKYNSWEGGSGGIRLIDPTTGAPGSARFQMLFSGFGGREYLNAHDEVQQVSDTLSVSWTALSGFEIFGSYTYRGTESRFIEVASNGSEMRRQKTYAVMGNALLGFKYGGKVSKVLNLGGDLNFLLPNKEGSIMPGFGALGVRLRASANTDLQELESPVPLILRLNIGYLFDQSAELIKNIENTRYNNLDYKYNKHYEVRHLITRLERFALNINRVDLFTLGLGAEMPRLRLVDEFYVHPLLEWNIGIPSNRGGYICPSRKTKDGDIAPVPGAPTGYIDDKCLADEGIGAIPMTLDLGMRIVTSVRGLSALAGASIGLAGTSTFIRELAPTAPYQIIGAISYDYDARPPEADIKVIEHVVDIPPPPKGRVMGLVVAHGTNVPVEGAAVQIGESDLSPVMTRTDGRFVTYELDPGAIQLAVSHPQFEQGLCLATIADKGGDASVTCALVPAPVESTLRGRVIDNFGIAVAGASVFLSGANSYKFTTEQDGLFDQKVTPGQYSARVEAPGFLERTDSFTVAPSSSASVDILVVRRPAISNVSQKGNTIRLSGDLAFARGSSQVPAEGTVLLADLTDYLQRNPQIRKIKVEGPTDRDTTSTALALDRADAIKRLLVGFGIAPERVEAVAGSTRRLAITVE
jgi:outer membrane protein OmpA-like peptidoglycan-associated protein